MTVIHLDATAFRFLGSCSSQVSRPQRINPENVLYIGEHQLLMLLLMINPDFQ